MIKCLVTHSITGNSKVMSFEREPLVGDIVTVNLAPVGEQRCKIVKREWIDYCLQIMVSPGREY